MHFKQQRWVVRSLSFDHVRSLPQPAPRWVAENLLTDRCKSRPRLSAWNVTPRRRGTSALAIRCSVGTTIMDSAVADILEYKFGSCNAPEQIQRKSLAKTKVGIFTGMLVCQKFREDPRSGFVNFWCLKVLEPLHSRYARRVNIRTARLTSGMAIRL